MDLFLVPTISFRLLYGLLILQHNRRKLVWLAVTAHPSAEWLARQLTEAYGWQQAPRYIIRDRDRVHGGVFFFFQAEDGIRDRALFRLNSVPGSNSDSHHRNDHFWTHAGLRCTARGGSKRL